MALSSGKLSLSYERLKQEVDDEDDLDRIWEEVIGKSLRRSRFRKLRKIRRLKLRFPGVKRLLRKKVSSVKIAWRKVCERLKESRAHFGDIFAGNYAFIQVTPNSIEEHEVSKKIL